MKAFWYEEAGSASDVIQKGEMDIPQPGPGDVRVKIEVSAINPTDFKRRQLGRELGRFPRIIPNNDGAGVIDAVGAGVDTARLGERVWIFGAQANRAFGTGAEYCALPARQTRPLPDRQSFDDGACLGVPAVTAHRALFADGDIAGQTILITGGAGRVGRYGVQMAKLAGATVIATAGNDENIEHIRALGADHVLNYKSDDIVAAAQDITDGTGVDRIVDVAFGANIKDAPALIRDNGVITAYSSDGDPNPMIPFRALMYKNITVRPFAIFGMPAAAQDAAFAHIDKLLNAGTLRHHVGARYGFGDMIAAHTAMERDGISGACLVHVTG